jgi:DNA-binding MarR family transcriptional regulator
MSALPGVLILSRPPGEQSYGSPLFAMDGVLFFHAGGGPGLLLNAAYWAGHNGPLWRASRLRQSRRFARAGDKITCDHIICDDIISYDINASIGARFLKLSRRFGFLLKDVSSLYVQRFEQHAELLGLTLPQCKTLMRLAENEGVNQVKLAELTDLEPMTLVRILDRMEAEGWLERRGDPRDRRVRCLYLTGKSKPLLDDVRRLMDLTWADAFSGISKDKGDLVIELLDRVRSNLMAVVPVPVSVDPALRSRGTGRGTERATSKS